MKFNKLFISSLVLPVSLVSMISVTSCNLFTKTTNKVTSITLSCVSSIRMGTTENASVTVLPNNATDKSVTYASSDTTVATIDTNGKISPKKLGTTTITATAKDGSGIKSNSVEITIIESTVGSETPEEYISNRTFAISGQYQDGRSTSACVGTSWVIADATPDDATDYSYYIATNWHVAKGIKKLESEKQFKIVYGASNKIAGLDLDEDYVEFKSIQALADSNFYLDGKTTAEYWNGTSIKSALAGIDLFIYQVTFFDKTDTLTSVQKTAKTKLDVLNTYTYNNKNITEFADSVTTTTHYESKDLYIGGYPAMQQSYYSTRQQTWTYHSLKGENINLSFAEPTLYTNHSCDDDASLVDNTPQYILDEKKQQPLSPEWMPGGASGSMLMANFGSEQNPDYKVCAIYWGGLEDEAETQFYPHFSIFNSYVKNYITIE